MSPPQILLNFVVFFCMFDDHLVLFLERMVLLYAPFSLKEPKPLKLKSIRTEDISALIEMRSLERSSSGKLRVRLYDPESEDCLLKLDRLNAQSQSIQLARDTAFIMQVLSFLLAV